MRAREELELKESEWRSERELYDSHLRGEHNRLLSLWRQVVTFRRHFLEMKTATDRDLSELKAEQMRLSGSILVNCSRLNSCVQLRKSIPLGKPVQKDQAEQQVEPKINQTAEEVVALQVRWDMEKKELQDRVMELSALLVQSQKQNEEKEKTMKTLNDTVEILESSWIEKEFAASLTNSAKEENLLLQKLIKNITEMVLDDSDSMVSIICTDSSQHAVSGDIFSAPRSVDAGHAFGLVLEALARMRGATQALREELSARQDSNNILLQQQRHQEEKCREVQQRLEQLEEKCKKSSSHQQHLQSLVETLRSDCANLEKTREELQEQLGLMEQEASCLRQSNAELQMKEESALAEKAEQQDRMERALHEQELLVKDLAALEEKHSSLQSELIAKRQTLEKLQLQKDLLEQEKDEFAMALEKAERSVAELMGTQNKMNAERADLQAAAAKMSSINEALALDKVQLNKCVWQLEQEKEVLSAKVGEMERARICEQEKLNFCERANKELCAEKAQLEQLLKEAEEQQEKLWLELRTLEEEKAETQEKFHQVSQEQESSSRALEQLRQQSSGQGHALAQVCREKELLGQEKAALEGRLAATERHQHDLSKQLTETRSAKESLESSLFAAQQQISQLEITRNHLEAQVLTVREAKEVIQGEVKCLLQELEAERALRRKEQEERAQQLLQAEQHHESLRLQGTAQQMEINKLLQDLVGDNMLLNCPSWACGKNPLLFASVQVLQEEQNEKRALTETLLQTRGQLSQACQQVQQLRQEVKEQQEKGQTIKAKLQAELQEAHNEMLAVQRRHKEELQGIREEMNVLLEQRDALQKQVEELTSQLAASREFLESRVQRAQQDVSEAQAQSRQKQLEAEHIQKRLEEAEHQKNELQVYLQNVEQEWSQWEEVSRQNSELHAFVRALKRERTSGQLHHSSEAPKGYKCLSWPSVSLFHRLTLSLEEKDLSLRTLEENNLAQINQVSQLRSALNQAEELHSEHKRELQELNTQIQALQDAVTEKAAQQDTREKELLQELEKSQAGEQSLRDAVHVLQVEMSELRLRLQSSEEKAEAMATQCQQASGAHQETQSQLDKLLLVLYHMIRDSRDLITWSSEGGHVMGLTDYQAGDVPADLTVDRVTAALQDLQQHLEHSQKDLNDARKKIQALELELGTGQAQMDNLRASSQKLQKELDESQAALWRAEQQKTSLETALREEAVTVRQEVASLQRKLESQEKERKDLLHEWDRLQADKEKLEYEIKLLEESVTASETRANTAVDKNHSLEQELQTALSMLKIKNEEVQNQGKKMEILQKEAAETKALQEHLTRVTAILSEREGEMKLYQEQMRMLEKQKEMHKTALNQVIKDITEKEQKTESQQEQIQELEKQQEKQRIVLSKMSQELEEKDQEIRSQQELIKELEKQLELQNSAVSRVSKELEERHQEIKFQEEKIMILEQHGAIQVRNLLVDLDDMKGNLKEKRLELLSLTQQIQELEKEREDVKSLYASLEHLRTVLKDRESECDTQREELRLLQQHKEQQDGHLQELLGKVEIMTLSLSKKDEELESQQKKMKEVEEVMQTQLKTVRDQLEQTLATLEEKDRLMDIQKQQTRSYEEKTEEQMNVLHRDLEYSRTILKEKDLTIESQKELIDTFQKQKQDSEQQKQILQCLQVELKEKVQEILSLRKQCEGCKEKEEKCEAEQRNFHTITLTLKEKEEKICVLEDAITKLQEQKEETAVQTKAILQKLEYAESSIEAKDQELVSLQEHVQDLREQKEVAGKQAKSLEQDLDKANQMLQKNHLEFLRQTEQINTFHHREESMKVALTSCQKQVTLLEEVVRKKDEDNDVLRQKLQHVEEELKTLQNLQLRLAEKNEEVRHDGEQEFLKEAFPEREGEIMTQSERKQSEEEIRALQEDLQHVQQNLTKKDKEIKYQTDRVKYLKKTLIEREQELRRQSEVLKELTLALQWKDEGETLTKQIQKLQKWEEEEEQKRKILQERDHLLQRQKEITQQLEAEREANSEELEFVAAALKQRESREHEWRENAQVLSAALSKSEMANGNLKKEITILQRMVAERDTDRFHLQQAVAEGEQLSWLSEKRLMLQSLECLQRAIAKLEDEKVELKQQNTELRRTLEQVEHERRRLKRCFRGRLLPDASGFSLSESEQYNFPTSRQEESHAHCSQRLAELAPAHGISFLNAQQAVAEGEQLSWLSEKRLMLQSLECLQRAIAKLEDEKVELKQQNTELRRTLEQVEHERRRLKRCFRGRLLPDASGFSLSESEQYNFPTSRQQAVAEGEQLSWLSEKRLMLQSLECLQRAIAKLEDEKVELKQQNTELRRTLEQVEHERRRLKRCFRGRLLPDASGFSLSESEQYNFPTSRQEESHAHCSQRLAELQNQVSLLQSQLARDRQHRQNYIESCSRTSQELSDLHQELSCSFAAVLKEPKAAVLEEETRKLDRSLSLNSARTSLTHQSLERTPEHSRTRPARSDDDLR
ncbi:LOW QUALITY PROTEIN: centrosome-associated protein CEP250 [Cyanistes caeruleus]|uniref:LOW QUALITY PROTEIN: centrosome-associated protein CEP250 n=1 Tax=Cyanistes caeruleus TaxID=156563 RepID=UPI000CDB64C1|nr:LOW QUALITY PROTEIN: centrosome-associated protein CEP250 [Cyanistes caeruleus]